MASDVGATIVGVDTDNLLRFAYELVWAVSEGQLQPDKFCVAIRAVGLGEDLQPITKAMAEVLW